MAADDPGARLAAELTALGRDRPGTAPGQAERLAGQVTARISTLDVPRPPRPRTPRARARRWAAAGVAALLLALLGVPPVRAAVAQWFGFAGVRVRVGVPGPGAGGGTAAATPEVPPATGTVPLDRARAAVTFPVAVPAALGAPERVEVSADRRVVSLSWTLPDAGVVRLDEFGAELDYAFAKTARQATFTSVGDAFALWFDAPHEVVVLGPDGAPRTAAPRLAGHTLIWAAGATTYRLEGALGLDRATAIARSVPSG